jgi:hypothetical protein
MRLPDLLDLPTRRRFPAGWPPGPDRVAGRIPRYVRGARRAADIAVQSRPRRLQRRAAWSGCADVRTRPRRCAARIRPAARSTGAAASELPEGVNVVGYLLPKTGSGVARSVVDVLSGSVRP